MSDKPKSKAFKDWFDRAAARSLAKQVAGAWPKFDEAAFVRRAGAKLNTLEFSGRVQQFADALAAGLPSSIPKALQILVKSLPEPLSDADQVTDAWLQWPVGQFIADHGLDAFDESFVAMIELTKRFSSEFAVRPFVEHHPEQTFERLLALTADPNPHVRRWCSEGVRPRLPWGKKLRALVDDPGPIWPILEALKDDPELYVRRSVANTLGDIAKDHQAAVVKRCRAWAKGASPERQWLIKHALRGPIKAGDPAALAAIGFSSAKGLRATLSASPKRIKVGESVALTAEVGSSAKRKQSLMIDYVVHYVRQRD
ncbi:MAG: DNA alkylation repair protein, partial [Myxococcota bacterium]